LVLGSVICPARRDSHASRFCCITFCPTMESLAGSYRSLFMLVMDSLGFITEIMSMKIDQWPNQSPEPTAVAAAVAIPAASRRWLSFFR